MNNDGMSSQSMEVVMETQLESTPDVVMDTTSQANGGTKLSFKDSRVGIPESGPFDEGCFPNDKEVCKDEEKEDCPTIYLTSKKKARLWSP